MTVTPKKLKLDNPEWFDVGKFEMAGRMLNKLSFKSNPGVIIKSLITSSPIINNGGVYPFEVSSDPKTQEQIQKIKIGDKCRVSGYIITNSLDWLERNDVIFLITKIVRLRHRFGDRAGLHRGYYHKQKLKIGSKARIVNYLDILGDANSEMYRFCQKHINQVGKIVTITAFDGASYQVKGSNLLWIEGWLEPIN